MVAVKSLLSRGKSKLSPRSSRPARSHRPLPPQTPERPLPVSASKPEGSLAAMLHRLRGPAPGRGGEDGEPQGRRPSGWRARKGENGASILGREGLCGGPVVLTARLSRVSFRECDSAPTPTIPPVLPADGCVHPAVFPKPAFQSPGEAGTAGPSPCREVAERQTGESEAAPGLTSPASAPPSSARRPRPSGTRLRRKFSRLSV